MKKSAVSIAVLSLFISTMPLYSRYFIDPAMQVEPLDQLQEEAEKNKVKQRKGTNFVIKAIVEPWTWVEETSPSGTTYDFADYSDYGDSLGFGYGFGMELLFNATGHFSLGLGFALNPFHQIYTNDTTSYQYSFTYINVPLYATSRLYFTSGANSPYLTGSIGYDFMRVYKTSDDPMQNDFYGTGGGLYWGAGLGFVLGGIQLEGQYVQSKAKYSDDSDIDAEYDFDERRIALSFGFVF